MEPVGVTQPGRQRSGRQTSDITKPGSWRFITVIQVFKCVKSFRVQWVLQYCRRVFSMFSCWSLASSKSLSQQPAGVFFGSLTVQSAVWVWLEVFVGFIFLCWLFIVQLVSGSKIKLSLFTNNDCKAATCLVSGPERRTGLQHFSWLVAAFCVKSRVVKKMISG